MTASTAINLSPAMVTALKGAYVDGHLVYPAGGTKAQTLKGLESRGLMIPGTGRLNADGYEAARQLGAEVPFTGAETGSDGLTDDVQLDQQDTEIQMLTESMSRVTPEMVTQAAENLLKTPDVAELNKAVDLDKPVIVPNREDKRKTKFKLRGALSRLVQRQKARRMAKYGSTKFGEAA